MIWAPLSEIYGRLYVYHGTNLGFIAFTVACGVAPSLSSLIAFRFFAGFFGSCILANGGGSFSDMMPVEKRGIFLTLFVLGPVLGPVVGPVGGGFLASAKGWPWLFWLVTILVGVVSLMLLIFTKETYAPILLRRKVERLRRETGNPRLRAKGQRELSPWVILRHNIVRPLRLSIMSPVSIIYSLDIAIVYGILNLLFTSISQVFQETYNFAPNISGLAFLGLGVGCFIGVVTAGATSNMYTERVRAKTGGERKPEHRIFLQPIGACLIPAGLFIYGWTAEYKVHWIAPIIGEGITGLGIMLIFSSTILYLVDAFTVVAASALAANGLIRSIAGGLLPLAGLTLYSNLGVGWGNSVLAFISLIILPISIGMVRYGEYLRKRYEVKNL